MSKHSSIEHGHDEMELDAYNAAFFDLGFRWHWDRATYNQLLHQSPEPSERILSYLRGQHPHLLKAYDAAFLVDAIETRKTLCRARSEAASGTGRSAPFDWAESRGCELGA
jgi:hypothetical protein